MFNIDRYLSDLIHHLRRTFSTRLIYVGLQGSHLRGEASENSDIDVMVVIDELSAHDLSSYRTIIQSTGCYDKSCGFICSKVDLANWNPLEICNLLHNTKDYYGSLNELVPTYTEGDIRNFVKVSVNNLYHEISHRYIHAGFDKNLTNLPFAYKSVFFILQNLYYLEHKKFIITKTELLSAVDGKDRTVLQHAIELSKGVSFDFHESFELLFTWCQETLLKM